ncbi:MAG: acetyl-CoA carboxylase carboxyl transferase subunit alpha [Eubacteriaceae bacterium]|jgi:acetyl-CoA carboxylase carboxyl transferase subunit alpha|nr:acetyl-CoA carboxylase carboxyl transferase subunit alpha [Eubacteriaceae bacterium]
MEKNLTKHSPVERVALAREAQRPKIRDYISALFEDFFETHGDRLYGDDKSMLCGIARFGNIPVTVAGNIKAATLAESIECNFGMANPEGYRKFQRAALQAEKFKRPIITFIDTPGAYPGVEAEMRGQGEAIARCIFMLSSLRVPIIAVFTGEGGSGGALAIAVSDRILMMENAIFSILSPEGFASILWKDSKRRDEACELMKLISEDLEHFGIADRIVEEPEGGAPSDPKFVFGKLKLALEEELSALMSLNIDELIKQRRKKYRFIGV